MDEPTPIVRIGYVMPIMSELLRDVVTLRSVWPFDPNAPRPSEEEIAAARAAQRARHAAKIEAANRRHEAAKLRTFTARLRSVLDLHAPQPGSLWGVECHGCEYGGYEAEPPDWPCSTWVVAAGEDVSE